jgi:hypothetical protein
VVERWFTDPARPEYPEIDLEMAAAIDTLDFAMPISRKDDLLVIRNFPI